MKKTLLILLLTVSCQFGFAQSKKVLLEEFSGAHCSQCPMGYYILDSLLNIYPDLIGVSLHSYTSYDSMYFSQLDTISTPYAPGAPLGAIDRILWDGSWSYVAQLYTKWDTFVQVRLDVTPMLTVSLNALWNSLTRDISAQVSTEILTNMPSGDYRFNLYVVEDSVTGTGPGFDQFNIYNTLPGNPFYGMGDPIVGYAHRHVVRAILQSAWGVPGIISSSPSIGQNFNYIYNYTLPTNIQEDRVTLVAFISKYTVDHQGDEVLNVIDAKLTQATGLIEGPLTEISVSLYPNPFTQETMMQIIPQDGILITDCELKIYDLAGREVNVAYARNSDSFVIRRDNVPPGIYFCKLLCQNQTISIRTMVIN